MFVREERGTLRKWLPAMIFPKKDSSDYDANWIITQPDDMIMNMMIIAQPDDSSDRDDNNYPTRYLHSYLGFSDEHFSS